MRFVDSAKNDDAKYAIEKIAADYGLDLSLLLKIIWKKIR